MYRKATRTHFFSAKSYGRLVRNMHITVRARQMDGWEVVHMETTDNSKFLEPLWQGFVIFSAPLSTGERNEGLFEDVDGKSLVNVPI